MINRLVLYYGFLLPLLIIYTFGSPLIRDLFLLFFTLLTIKLPYFDDFIDKALKRFIPFLLTIILVMAAVLLMIDIVDVLYNLTPNALFLLIIPFYFVFKLLTFPWIFDRWGVVSLKKAFKEKNENNWLILSALAFLLIVSEIPYLAFFLGAPISYIIADNLELSRN